MTLNGEIALILRYLIEFDSFAVWRPITWHIDNGWRYTCTVCRISSSTLGQPDADPSCSAVSLR